MSTTKVTDGVYFLLPSRQQPTRPARGGSQGLNLQINSSAIQIWPSLSAPESIDLVMYFLAFLLLPGWSVS